MRILSILLLTLLASSCSWWPFGKTDSGNCMDDNSCDASEPINQPDFTGTWHCYGVHRDEPWDCSEKADPSKITTISEEAAEPTEFATTTRINRLTAAERAEIMLDDETIQHPDSVTAPESVPENLPESDEATPATATAAAPDTAARLFGFPDESYTVQLIALQSVEEVLEYAAQYDLQEPEFVRIESQGSDWYVLLLGVYNTLSEASRVADSWYADKAPRTRPWVRPTGPLKKAVVRAQSSGD